LEIIEILNDRFGTDFTEADRLFFEQVREEAKANEICASRTPPTSSTRSRGTTADPFTKDLRDNP
jgi:type I restriction enzyme, R subunit